MLRVLVSPAKNTHIEGGKESASRRRNNDVTGIKIAT
jgi:hypothetical protein